MENFKTLHELLKIDNKHLLMGKVCGSIPTIEGLHEHLSNEILNEEVPDEIKGQFNIARNMALYSFYFYALAPEVQLKTYTIIEQALKLKAGNRAKPLMLKGLIKLAIKESWISDSGFRHIDNPCSDNWVKGDATLLFQQPIEKPF